MSTTYNVTWKSNETAREAHELVKILAEAVAAGGELQLGPKGRHSGLRSRLAAYFRTTTTYNVTWKSDETTNTSDLPAEGLTLEQVVEICKAEGVRAELYDEAGFCKGTVSANGIWRLY